MRKEREFNIFVFVVTIILFAVTILTFGKEYLEYVLLLPLVYQSAIDVYSKSRKDRISRIEDINPYVILIIDLLMSGYFYKEQMVVLYLLQTCLSVHSLIYLMKDADLIKDKLLNSIHQYNAILISIIGLIVFILINALSDGITTINQAFLLSFLYTIGMYLHNEQEELIKNQIGTQET